VITTAKPVKEIARPTNKILKLILIIGLLAGLALLLTACDYPGQDPPCVGSNKNAEGCADPVQKIVDDQNGGPWYVSWALDIVRSVLSSVSINSVRLGISVFWQVFTNLASTDFASCGSGGTGATCQAASVFSMVNTVAVLFLPLILVYKIFKSYFLGGLIESFHEGFLSFFPKIIIGGFAMYFLAVLFSGAFGLSNLLFDTIIGGAASLADISKNMLGNCPNASVCGSGIGSVGDVKNIGLLLFVTIICLLAAIVFMVLGLVFFLRTIIVFILFALSPLAIVAGLTEEFRPWFQRWLQSVQAMLIAPIPVAICFALVKAFTGAIPSANGDPAGFILQLVYIISFLAIGAILMFKIAGSVGGMAFGLAAAGLGMLTQGLVGAGLSRSNEGGEASAGETDKGNTGKKGGKAGNSSPASSSQYDNGLSGEAIAAGAAASGGSSFLGAPGTSSAGAEQQQRQLLNALRSLNENISVTTRQNSTVTTRLPSERRLQAARTAGFNMQNGLLWMGNEAGISAPYFQFSPPAVNHQSTTTIRTTSEQNTSKSYPLQSQGQNQNQGQGQVSNPLEEGATGQVPPVQTTGPVQPQVVSASPQSQPPPPSPAVTRPLSSPAPATTPQGQPVAQPVVIPAQPRRMKVSGVIPNPYGQPTTGGNGKDPLFIGKAEEDTI